MLVTVISILSVASAGAQATGDEGSQQGEGTFQEVCSACHTIGRGNSVGPDLKGVTERRDEEWLKVHILSPSVHQAQQDPIAVANREKFGFSMPDLGLTEQQVEAVIAYLRTGQESSKTIPGLYVPTLATGALAIVVLTLLGLRWGTKRVEVRP